MNYQEFIKNIYTSLKSINLKQQKLEEHFQTIFQKIEDLDDKVNKVSNKLDDFIDASNRLKEEKSNRFVKFIK
jgi:peptidoglycan hydrolase CwlO-like protein